MPGNRRQMTSLERLSTALRSGVPDRVPVVLVSSLHGAKELGIAVPEYFSRAENVAEGQLRFVERVGHDNVDAFFYFGLEAQAFGAEILFHDGEPPDVGAPILPNPAAIDNLQAPDPRRASSLREVLRATEMLADKARGRWLVVGRALGPCSLPIMLMGLESWLDLLLFGDEARRQRLLQITSQFSVAWAKALLAAGADIIALVEPMASATMLTREQATKLVLPVVGQAVRDINGPVIFWSLGAIQPVADLIRSLGVQAVSTDPGDDLREVKRIAAGRMAVLGGLNDLGMLSWTLRDAEEKVREAIQVAAPGGGFILSHQYEIPAKVSFDVLVSVVDAAKKWGRYTDEKSQRQAR
ncbi:MAG: uroporphyrinogen decarboxylase family protein [Chloroflexi bacterium]|nr:uroporphyrinogen decarboxylase family protein [Chloroflexota bacterium]